MDYQCCIGGSLKEECDITSYTVEKKLYNISKLTKNEKELLLWRTGASDSSQSVCSHHKEVFLVRYEKYQNLSCCDPFQYHKKKITRDVRIVSLDFAKKIRLLKSSRFTVIPGQKLCSTCRKKIQALIDNDSHSESQTADTSDVCGHEDQALDSIENLASKEAERQQLDKSLTELGMSPLKMHSLPSHSRKVYMKRKIKKMKSCVKAKVSRVILNSNKEDLPDSSDTGDDTKEMAITNQKAKDLDVIVDLMKAKIQTVNRRRKIQILTMAPNSWSRDYIKTTFNVSEYMVREARNLVKQKGICELPEPRKGKKLPDHTLQLVSKFYQDDEYSRIMPGKSDCVSIGKNVYEQKRLILSNLHELFAAFKGIHPGIKIGFSKFCSLRPKWCVVAGSSGTHAVCICSIHQNVELLVQAMNINESTHELVDLMVCDRSNRSCCFGQCEECPGDSVIKEHLSKHYQDEDEDIEFCQWQTTDRAQLVTMRLPVDEFLELVMNKLHKLIPHSYISKAQAKYLKDRKEHLPDDTALVLMDFAENYTFVMQDEIQSYHWSHSSATVHPVVIYYKLFDDLHEFSVCVISDDLEHDVPLVYQIQKLTVDIIKERCHVVTKIEYFSDGCAAQYKNCKNMLNLCHHESDFGLTASWSFFATSHGKSPCDGIGGAVKRMTTKASLQRPYSNQILSAEQMFEFCSEQISKITFNFISKSEMMAVRKTLSIRFEQAKTITGTRSFHFFSPLSITTISTKLISADDAIALTFHFNSIPYDISDQLKTKCFVCCNYDFKWYIGQVEEIDQNEGDVRVKFMHPNGPSRSFHWPTRVDECWVPFPHVLCVADIPTTQSGRQYQLTPQCQEKIARIWLDFNNEG